ncbi:amino acid adenylation domain-containing protein [Kitasatospora sp. MAA4]|uniref:non-ribosomal peptide synthetase n=1 Tax=Kitasatospora sp. MAA4 TaxID=3035093 RepID=UPI002472F461|nr:non-ribosomal peptide synthetase [Kitasatospora sp. MAA4]MDH6133735.1 amino acid adenylation domain-containing protein [Kitasatospora sp. MAA4]
MEAELMDSRAVALAQVGNSGAAACVPQLFEEVVRATPEAVALVAGDVQLSYAELNAGANRLADLLRERGTGPEGVVAISLPRGPELVTAALAVLKSGAGYLPLDPALPRERRAYLLATAGMRIVVGPDSGDGLEVLDPSSLDLTGRPAEDHAPAVGPADLAYLIFTSGSTGRPKPVAVTHGSLAHHALAVRAAFGLGSTDRVLQFANPAFDVFGEEIYPTLLAGATVAVAPDPVPPPTELEAYLRSEQVTVANLPTPYWDQWVRDLDASPRPVPQTLRLLVVGSDTAYTRTLKGWWRHCAVTVLNAYGLTETTITATLQAFTGQQLPAGDTLPIGRPLGGAEAYLLDAELDPVAAGTPGELYLGGALLARGYAGHPALTAERFVPDAFSGRPGARLYRTGDLAQWLPDGTLAFLGRADDQVKIRGQRVEPTEISTALCTHPAVRQAHVRAVDDAQDGKRLVAYVVGEGVQPAELRAHLATSLPPAMVPAAYVLLAELPLTPNGKIDQRALPLPTVAASSVAPPLSGLEEQIAAVWREVLRTDRVGPDDSFFDIGGHSLLLVQVQRRLADVLGHPIPGVALFAHPTVRRLAAHLSPAQDSTDADDADDADRADERRNGRARLQQRRARQSSGGAR